MGSSKEDFDVIAVVGVGLIGGSFGMAARTRGLAGRVIGIGRNEQRLQRARELGAIDELTLTPAAGVAQADLVVVCTPVGLIVPTISKIAAFVKPGAIITDVGSTKAEVVAGAEAAAPACAHFVGGHPMTGSEASGVETATPDLFEGAAYVITRSCRTNEKALERLQTFARRLGARTLVMNPEEHDRCVAVMSHLPHILAAAALEIADLEEHSNPGHVFSIAAGSFRDLTRVSGSSPELWRDICLSNRAAIVDALLRFEDTLSRMRRVVETGDGPEVEGLFERARELRELLAWSKE